MIDRERVMIVEKIARCWNDAGINYSVMHGLENYPASIGRDMDILVQESDTNRAINIARDVLSSYKLVVVSPPPLWGERLVALRDSRWSGAIEIHTMHRLSWRNVVFAHSPNVLVHEGVFKIDPWASFAKRLLMPLLAGGIHRFLERPREFSFKQGEPEVVNAKLPKFFGLTLSQILCDLIQNNNVKAVGPLVRKLRRALILRAFVQHPLGSISVGAHSVGRRVIQPFRPCAPIVALLGDDTIVKSNLIESLAGGDPSIFTKVIVRHFRPRVLREVERLFRVRAAGPNADAKIALDRDLGHFRWLWVCYYLLDFAIGHVLKDRTASSQQRLVLYNGHALEIALAPSRYGFTTSRGIELFRRFIPKPDLVVLLQTKSACSFSSQPELIEEAQICLAEQGRISAVLRTDALPEDTIRQMRNLITEVFILINS